METTVACAKFAGGFVAADTEVIVVVTGADNVDVATVKTRADTPPSSPREAVSGIAEAYGIGMDDVRATVYAVIGGADGKMV